MPSGMPKEASTHKSVLPLVIGGIVVVGLLGLSIKFYLDSSTLNAQIISLTTQSKSLSVQLAALTKKNTDLTTQLTAFTAENADLNMQLALYAIPMASPKANSTASSTGVSLIPQPVDITFKGTLGSGGKAFYAVTSSKGLVVSVKNSKDTKVDAVLKPLLGTIVQIMGTHFPGSPEIIVKSVNGTSIQ